MNQNDDLADSIRRIAWEMGLQIYYDRKRSFIDYAHERALGPPLTRELDMVVNGDFYFVQGFRDGIVFVKAEQPDKIMHIDW